MRHISHSPCAAASLSADGLDYRVRHGDFSEVKPQGGVTRVVDCVEVFLEPMFQCCSQILGYLVEDTSSNNLSCSGEGIPVVAFVAIHGIIKKGGQATKMRQAARMKPTIRNWCGQRTPT